MALVPHNFHQQAAAPWSYNQDIRQDDDHNRVRAHLSHRAVPRLVQSVDAQG